MNEFDVEESEEKIRREDISYKGLLLNQMFLCQEKMSECFSGQEHRANTKTFLTSVEALKTLLFPYLTPELKKSRLDIKGLNPSKRAFGHFRIGQKQLEQLIQLMADANLLLETSKTVKM